MSNPIQTIIDSWNDLERKVDGLTSADRRDSEKLDAALAAVRSDVTRVRSDVESVVSRLERTVVNLQDVVSQLRRDLEDNVGSKVLPLRTDVEACKEAARNHSTQVAGLVQRHQELDGKITKIQGAFSVLQGG